jgi:hypothetical protein
MPSHLRRVPKVAVFSLDFRLTLVRISHLHCICSSWPGNLFNLNLIILITFVEEYKLWRTSLYIFFCLLLPLLCTPTLLFLCSWAIHFNAISMRQLLWHIFVACCLNKEPCDMAETGQAVNIAALAETRTWLVSWLITGARRQTFRQKHVFSALLHWAWLVLVSVAKFHETFA